MMVSAATPAKFQSTLPVWGATWGDADSSKCGSVSIHAPRVGSDAPLDLLAARSTGFNPRSPCGERRTTGSAGSPKHGFQSTLPVWGATKDCGCFILSSRFQSTLPVWGATPDFWFDRLDRLLFQSTLPVWGATIPARIPLGPVRFQSTLPVWGATQMTARCGCPAYVSIHAPRVGSDEGIK